MTTTLAVSPQTPAMPHGHEAQTPIGPQVAANPQPSVSQRVIAEIKAGGTIPAIASRVGTSETFVRVMFDHFARLGMTGTTESLCNSGSGACGPSGATTDQARVACAGCAFAR